MLATRGFRQQSWSITAKVDYHVKLQPKGEAEAVRFLARVNFPALGENLNLDGDSEMG